MVSLKPDIVSGDGHMSMSSIGRDREKHAGLEFVCFVLIYKAEKNDVQH